MIFGKIFVGVTSRVWCFLGSSSSFISGELTTVGNGYVFVGFVALAGGEILDLANDCLAV